MMNLNRFDNGIKRLNQLMLFVILGLILLFIIWGLGSEMLSKLHHKTSEVTIKTTDVIKSTAGKKEEMVLHLGSIERITSANTFIASIEERENKFRATYDKVNTTKRNVLFIPDSGNGTHLLFDNYGNKIVSFRPYPENSDTNIIVCRYIKNYSTDTSNKKTTMMLLKPDGSNAENIIDGMDSLLKLELNKNKELSVIYFKDGKLINAKYSTTTLKPILPPAVFNLANSKLENVNADEVEE